LKVRSLIEESADGQLLNQAELQIRNQQGIRDGLQKAEAKIADLQNIYRKEANKRFSRVPPEELAARRQMVGCALIGIC
ncbi:unnamed protein product, partial [Heterosigma akashiwo]